MTTKVMTPEHGEQTFEADNWQTNEYSGFLLVRSNDVGVAEFAKGAWQFVYEVKESPITSPDPRVWGNISDVPISVVVRDAGGDRWEYRKDRWTCFYLGKWDEDINDSAKYEPFTEVLGAE